MSKLTWPAWFNSPDGKTSAIFETAEDVPSGWTSGAEKLTAGEKPAKEPAAAKAPAAKDPAPTPPAKEPAAAAPANGAKAELDAHGHPWSADLHASSKSKTTQGLWRMKVGVARPEPAPGYPLDL